MKELKDLAKTIKVNFVRVGFDPHTEQTKFVCLINGESFDFHCGLFACIPEKRKVPGLGEVNTLKYLERDLSRSYHTHNYEGIWRGIRQGNIKALKNWASEQVRYVYNRITSLCEPTSWDLLYCLQIDCRADSMSFSDFCSEFGYSDDSIKAQETYNACVANAKKLRKALGNELYKEVMEANPE